MSHADVKNACSQQSQGATRPIKQLLHRVVYDYGNCIEVTHTQLFTILNKEFDIDVASLHEIEANTYLKVLKRCLDEWPPWDRYEQSIKTLRIKNAYKAVRVTMETMYVELKLYITTKLEFIKPHAQDAVRFVTAELAKEMEN